MFGTGAPNNSDGNAVDMRLRNVRNQLPTPNGFQPSVENNSLENVTNDTPTVGLFPAKSANVSLSAQNNSLLPMDFVFVLVNELVNRLSPHNQSPPPPPLRRGDQHGFAAATQRTDHVGSTAECQSYPSIPNHWTSTQTELQNRAGVWWSTISWHLVATAVTRAKTRTAPW